MYPACVVAVEEMEELRLALEECDVGALLHRGRRCGEAGDPASDDRYPPTREHALIV